MERDTKTPNYIQATLIRLTQRYMKEQGLEDERERESLIVEIVRRMKESLGTTHRSNVFGINGKCGDVELAVSDLNLEPRFTKATAYNRSFGAGQETVCEGVDLRLFDDRTALEHTHFDQEVTGLCSLLEEYLNSSLHLERIGHLHVNLSLLHRLRGDAAVSYDLHNIKQMESSLLELKSFAVRQKSEVASHSQITCNVSMLPVIDSDQIKKETYPFGLQYAKQYFDSYQSIFPYIAWNTDVSFLSHPSYQRVLLAEILADATLIENSRTEQMEYRITSSHAVSYPICSQKLPIVEVTFSSAETSQKLPFYATMSFWEEDLSYRWNAVTQTLTLDAVFATSTRYIDQNNYITVRNYAIHPLSRAMTYEEALEEIRPDGLSPANIHSKEELLQCQALFEENMENAWTGLKSSYEWDDGLESSFEPETMDDVFYGASHYAMHRSGKFHRIEEAEYILVQTTQDRLKTFAELFSRHRFKVYGYIIN